MNHRTFEHLSIDIRDWVQDLTKDIDLVVGIPRSGLLPADLLALYLNVPITDLEGFLEGRLIETGERYNDEMDFETFDNIFIVDDSVASGSTMKSTKEQVNSYDIDGNIIYGAVYASNNGKEYVDHYYRELPVPRVFEWNMMHHSDLNSWCLDLDGVLCRDPLTSENDDGENYKKFLNTVKPRNVPSKKVGSIVTCRLEKYRDLTEEWLDEHNIEYEELVMMDYPNKEVRQAQADHARYKATYYSESDRELFVESDYSQAKKIARLSNKPVLCLETNQMLRQGYLGRGKRNVRKSVETVRSDPVRYLNEFLTNPVQFLGKAWNFLLG